MKKAVLICLSIIIITISLLLLKNYYNDNKVLTIDKKIKVNLKLKGFFGARDFTCDSNGNTYIAFKDRIQYIDTNGKSFDILYDKKLDIDSLEYYKNVLYFTSLNNLMSYDVNKKEQEILINTLPNFGDYRNSLIKILGDQIFVTIGAATNSGIVGLDNQWLKNNVFSHDFTPKDITLKGNNFGDEKTGAFTAYGTKNFSGQIVTAHVPGNASILIYNIKNKNYETYAYGIRNVKGLDFNSESKLIASVGGMENRGLRPVNGDSDYIYEIMKNVWYGWPDYSGGDPVTSPKFKGNNNSRLNFILENHPSTNPPAPIYQYKTLNSIGTLAVDKSGIIGEKDSIYFCDLNDNILYKLSKGRILIQEAFFGKQSKIVSGKFFGRELKLLDSNSGYIYSVECEK
ncbi:MAG: PQQ-dependent sugar dehydrogenase [Bacillota bacterium]|nr:PQQ-dependent sugar dehydrogenase [Bacillota bacterium]